MAILAIESAIERLLLELVVGGQQIPVILAIEAVVQGLFLELILQRRHVLAVLPIKVVIERLLLAGEGLLLAVKRLILAVEGLLLAVKRLFLAVKGRLLVFKRLPLIFKWQRGLHPLLVHVLGAELIGWEFVVRGWQRFALILELAWVLAVKTFFNKRFFELVTWAVSAFVESPLVFQGRRRRQRRNVLV